MAVNAQMGNTGSSAFYFVSVKAQYPQSAVVNTQEYII